MKIKQSILYFAVIFMISVFTACSGGTPTDHTENSGEISGKEILDDARDYADQQCKMLQKEKSIKKEVSDEEYERRMTELRRERKKFKNYYRKKYQDKPEEWTAFQRAVKSARQDSEFCQ